MEPKVWLWSGSYNPYTCGIPTCAGCRVAHQLDRGQRNKQEEAGDGHGKIVSEGSKKDLPCLEEGQVGPGPRFLKPGLGL